MENLKKMKECLVGIAENQVYGNIEKVNAQELGEVMDMIKDLSEAVYYCTITESMEKQAKEEYDTMYYTPYPDEMYEYRFGGRQNPHMMYAQNRGGNYGGSSSNGGNGGHKSYSGDMMRRYDDGQPSYMMRHDPMSGHYDPMMRDPKEGRSGERRRMYMEGKGYKDKIKQMQDLENYMQELASDMTEMIQDATPEEKTLIQQKLNTLAAKVK